MVRVIEEPSSPGLKLVVQQALRTIANLACGAGALKAQFLQHNPIAIRALSAAGR